MEDLMAKLRRIGMFFGGRSFEHEVSVRSMKSVALALDKTLFEPLFFPISKEGKIYRAPGLESFEKALAVEDFLAQCEPIGLDQLMREELACTFSTLHGHHGENGAFQGFCEVLDLPYVGPAVLGSAIGMDKEVTKRLLQQAAIPVVPYVALRSPDQPLIGLEQIGFPCFVKGASLGSSVGVYKCHSESEVELRVREIFAIDTKVLIEKAIIGREIEVSVLGSDHMQASIAGEIVPTHDFYTYEAKYLDPDGALLKIPAPDIDQALFKKLAIHTCQVLEIEGMARVDFFVVSPTEYYINEVNTLPGFTSISMYPKLFEASGLEYTDLITCLIELGSERFHRSRQLQKTLDGNLKH